MFVPFIPMQFTMTVSAQNLTLRYLSHNPIPTPTTLGYLTDWEFFSVWVYVMEYQTPRVVFPARTR